MFHKAQNQDQQAQSPAVCPADPEPVKDAYEVYPGWTIDDILRVICYVFGGAAGLVSLALFFLHAFNMRNPPEQIKIMRIVLVIPIFAGLSIVSIVVGQRATIVDPWKDFYEGVALSTFFTLVCTYVGPDRLAHQQYFSNLEVKGKDGTPVKGGGWGFFNRSAFFINQYVIVQFIICIATLITELAGVYCLHSLKPQFAHIWLDIINAISVALAVTAAIKVTMRLRKEMPDRPILKQLMAFKLLIFINWLQGIIFSLIAPHVTPTDTLSYNDITVGLPTTLLCIELLFFAGFFHIAYGHRPYLHAQAVPYFGTAPEDTRARTAHFHVSPLGAIGRAINPMSLPFSMREIFRARKSLGEMDDVEENTGLQPYGAVNTRSRSPSPAPKAYMGRGM